MLSGLLLRVRLPHYIHFMLLFSRRKSGRLERADLMGVLERIQSGSETALADLYDATAAKVYSSAMRITGLAADAEEITCDVYQCVWQTAMSYNPERGNPLQWLMVMTRSRALDCLRRRRLQRTCERSEDMTPVHGCPAAFTLASVPEEEVHQQEMAALIGHGLSKLPALQRRILTLAFFDGLSHSDIAHCTELPLGTVKSTISRTLRALRISLQRIAPAGPGPKTSRGRRRLEADISLASQARVSPVGG